MCLDSSDPITAAGLIALLTAAAVGAIAVSHYVCAAERTNERMGYTYMITTHISNYVVGILFRRYEMRERTLEKEYSHRVYD